MVNTKVPLKKKKAVKKAKPAKKAKSKTPMMKTYANFDLWKEDQTQTAQALIENLRKMINDCKLPLTETVKWGNGCWTKDNLPITYIYAMKDSVQLGFFAGTMVADPKALLEGKGKFIRFLTIRSKDDINKKYFSSLIKKLTKIKYR